MNKQTVKQQSGLHLLADRIERGMVWRWASRSGFSFEVTEESARLRREEWEEKRRVREERQARVSPILGGSVRGRGSARRRFRWVPGA